MANSERIIHGIDPVFDDSSRVLMLGSIPSPKSREQGFFYGHPQNRFWKVMAEVLGEDVPLTIEEKKAMLLDHGIALWDVLASCDIEGASDASIRNATPNDLRPILRAAPISAIFCTGAKAAELYRRHIEPELGIGCIRLPSTSPANAAMSASRLVDSYRDALGAYIDLPTPEIGHKEEDVPEGTSS